MKETYSINCFPIRIKEELVEIHWSENQSDDLIKTSKSKLTNQKNDLNNLVYWSLETFPNSSSSEIDATTNMSLFRDFLNEELYQHFKNLAVPHRRTFLGGSEIWVIDGEKSTAEMSVYRAFALRVLSPKDQFATGGWSILIGFQGEHATKRISKFGVEIPSGLITTFIFNNQVRRVNQSLDGGHVPPDAEVLINRKISKFLNQKPPLRRDRNKYRTNFDQIINFYSSQLKGQQIGSAIHVLESGMGQVFASNSWNIPPDSNVLEFGGNNSHFDAYMGLKEYGPFSGPGVGPYKLFFIFNKNDKDYANKLYQYFNRGLKGYPGIKSFASLDLNLEVDKTITFSNSERPHKEIDAQLSKMTFEDGVTYLAIYISPINRDDDDAQKRKEYFLVKQSLLMKGVSSQAIYKENINKPEFNYFLPNISIAILAKLKGRPWRLSRRVADELVFGIGAYRQKVGENDMEKYLGTTFTFRNDGTFVGFNSIRCDSLNKLRDFFESTLKKAVSELNGSLSSVKRVVIHFYKKMNNYEEKQLIDALSHLDLQAPYFVLNITGVKHYDYLVFDDTFAGKMPQSGTCIKLRNGEYLLCNNTRYRDRTGVRIADYPFPLKISIFRFSLKSTNEEINSELIDQVYQFSRMYWRSVKQRAMPVTILYSELIAEMTANLPNKELPQTTAAEKTLWFL